MFKKFWITMLSVIGFTTGISAFADEPVDAARKAALERLAVVNTSITELQEKIIPEKSAYDSAQEEYKAAEVALKETEARQKQISDDYDLLLPTNAQIRSLLEQSKKRFDAAAAVWTPDRKPTNPGEQKKADEFVEAKKEWDERVQAAKELRVRLKKEFPARFEEPLPSTVEEILKEQWSEILKQKKEAKKILEERKTPRNTAKTDYEASARKLSDLETERTQLLQALEISDLKEEVRDGLNRKNDTATTLLSGRVVLEVKSIREEMKDGFAATDGKIAALKSEVKADLQKVNDGQKAIRDEIALLKNAVAGINSEVADLVVAIGKIPLSPEENAERLELFKEILAGIRNNSLAQKDIETQLKEIKKALQPVAVAHAPHQEVLEWHGNCWVPRRCR